MTPAPGFWLSAIGQIALSVHDVSRAVTFYRDALGLSFLFEAPNMAFFDCGGIRLMLAIPEGVEGNLSSVIYFKADDIGTAAENLKSRGVSFEKDPHLIARMPDHELWMAFFRDPDKNLLALMCEKR